MERGKRDKVFSKGRLSLAEPPLFQNSPQDYFEIHLLQSAYRMGLSPSADGDEGFTLDLTTLLKKGRSKTFPFLTRIKTFARCGALNAFQRNQKNYIKKD